MLKTDEKLDVMAGADALGLSSLESEFHPSAEERQRSG